MLSKNGEAKQTLCVCVCGCVGVCVSLQGSVITCNPQVTLLFNLHQVGAVLSHGCAI